MWRSGGVVRSGGGGLVRCGGKTGYGEQWQFKTMGGRRAWTKYMSGGVTLLGISSTKHKERPLR
nr:hypothetical protein [Tanacetum cinerariifolium]